MKSNSEIRKQIAILVRSDDQLDAFCLDHFPAIKRQFTSGMTRLTKENLLIEQAEHETLEPLLWPEEENPAQVKASQLEPTGSSARAENMFQKISDLFVRFENVVNYDLTANITNETLPAIVKGKGKLKADDSLAKLKELTTALDLAFDACKKALGESGFWLTEQDVDSIDRYLKRFPLLVNMLNGNLTLIPGLMDSEQAKIYLILSTAQKIQQYRSLLTPIELERKNIESRLRSYKG